MVPDKGCSVTVTAGGDVEVDMVVGNTHTSITTADGRPDVQTQDITDLRAAEAGMHMPWPKIYTEARTVAGIDLRCLPPGSRLLDPNGLQDSCIAAREGYLAYSDGKPIALVLRVKPAGADPRFPYVMVKQPVSLRVIEHPDPKLFTAGAYTH